MTNVQPLAEHRWWRNGDHPHDGVGEQATDPIIATGTYTRVEGQVVRYFRHPDHPGDVEHADCGRTWNDHGWIDDADGGVTVCPGDWVVTGEDGRYFTRKPGQ